MKDIAFNSVDCILFRQFWSTYVKSETKIRRQDLSDTRLDMLFQIASDSIRTELAGCPYLAITTDGWTGNGVSFWSITVSGLNPEWKLVHHRLGCIPIFAPKHNSAVLASSIKSTFVNLELDSAKVVSVTTDEGGAAPLIASHFTGAKQFLCLAHRLNTILTNSFNEIIETIRRIGLVMDTCKRIVSSINHSVLRREQLIVNQIHNDEPVKTLKQQVDTRWNSWLSLFRSIKESQQSVMGILIANRQDFEWCDFVISNSVYFFRVLELLIHLLSLFEQSSAISCQENSITSPLIVAQTLWLEHQLSSLQLPNATKDDAQAIIDINLCVGILHKHLKRKIPLSDDEYICFALSPLHAYVAGEGEFEQSWNEALNYGYGLIERLLADESEPSAVRSPSKPSSNLPWSQAMTKMPAANLSPQSELNNFKQRKQDDINCGELEWWRANSSIFPRLSVLARKFLCIPSSQAASERDFSRMRRTCTFLRSSLNPDKLWKISLIAPALSKFWKLKSDKERGLGVTGNQSNELRRKRRSEKLKLRLSSISPNTICEVTAFSEEAENTFIETSETQTDDWSDEEFSEDDLEENDTTSDETVESDLDFEEIPPKRQLLDDSSIRLTRQSPCSCKIAVVKRGAYLFSATFTGFPEPHTGPPPLENLFKGVHEMIVEWTRESTRYYTFTIPNEERESCTARAFMKTYLLERFIVTDSMYNVSSMDIEAEA